MCSNFLLSNVHVKRRGLHFSWSFVFQLTHHKHVARPIAVHIPLIPAAMYVCMNVHGHVDCAVCGLQVDTPFITFDSTIYYSVFCIRSGYLQLNKFQLTKTVLDSCSCLYMSVSIFIFNDMHILGKDHDFFSFKLFQTISNVLDRQWHFWEIWNSLKNATFQVW